MTFLRGPQGLSNRRLVGYRTVVSIQRSVSLTNESGQGMIATRFIGIVVQLSWGASVRQPFQAGPSQTRNQPFQADHGQHKVSLEGLTYVVRTIRYRESASGRFHRGVTRVGHVGRHVDLARRARTMFERDRLPFGAIVALSFGADNRLQVISSQCNHDNRMSHKQVVGDCNPGLRCRPRRIITTQKEAIKRVTARGNAFRNSFTDVFGEFFLSVRQLRSAGTDPLVVATVRNRAQSIGCRTTNAPFVPPWRRGFTVSTHDEPKMQSRDVTPRRTRKILDESAVPLLVVASKFARIDRLNQNVTPRAMRSRGFTCCESIDCHPRSNHARHGAGGSASIARHQVPTPNIDARCPARRSVYQRSSTTVRCGTHTSLGPASGSEPSMMSFPGRTIDTDRETCRRALTKSHSKCRLAYFSGLAVRG